MEDKTNLILTSILNMTELLKGQADFPRKNAMIIEKICRDAMETPQQKDDSQSRSEKQPAEREKQPVDRASAVESDKHAGKPEGGVTVLQAIRNLRFINVDGDAEEEKEEQEDKAEENPAEKSLEKADESWENDVTSISKSDLSLTYIAFRITTTDGKTGDYELVASPLDHRSPSGKYMYWVQRFGSEKALAGVSESENGFEKVKVRFNGDIYFTVTARKNTESFSLNILIPEKYGKAEIVKNVDFGAGGHIRLHDRDTVVHVLPTAMSNTGEYADHIVVIDRGDSYESFISKNGLSLITMDGTDYEIGLEWMDDTVYSKVRMV